MIYISIVIVLIFASLFIAVVSKQAWRRRRDIKSWYIFLFLIMTGICIGAVAGTQIEYNFNPKTQILGFPFPLAVFVLEGEQWTDFVQPSLIQYCVAFTNVLFGLSFTLIPLAIRFRKQNHSKSQTL